ncbi:protein of unknown function [Pararobbsia alpina]
MSNVIPFHATKIRPEEDITGFVVRQTELSNVSGHSGLMTLLQRDGHRPAFVHSTNVAVTKELFHALLPSLNDVVMKHTRYLLNSVSGTGKLIHSRH